jgi:hypothetical protein
MWEVILRPHEDGLVVSITDGKTVSQIGRVAYNRWQSQRKLVTFKASVRHVIARAYQEAEQLNGMPVT